MTQAFRPLPNITLSGHIPYSHVTMSGPSVTPEDPALEVLTDFRRVKAVTISPDASIDACNQQMISHHVRLLLVVDEQQKVLGVITAADILGEKPMQQMQKTGQGRDELQVRDLMTSAEALEMIRLRDVEQARVGDIVETLIAHGRQHALVVDENDSSGKRICGLFSANQIGKQVGIAVEPSDVAKTFSELEKVIVAG